jgi:hypothetical protein
MAAMKFLSIGENCQVAGQLRRTLSIKTTYFDNLVTPFGGLLKALDRDIYKTLTAEDFDIGTWEGNPSAVERETGIFFHHEFRGTSEQHMSEVDIISHVKNVDEKFRFLSDRFLKIARNSGKKCFVRRQYDGSIISREGMRDIYNALEAVGATNFFLLNVHSSPTHPGLIADGPILFRYLENKPEAGWMGDNSGWADTLLAAAAHIGVLR